MANNPTQRLLWWVAKCLWFYPGMGRRDSNKTGSFGLPCYGRDSRDNPYTVGVEGKKAVAFRNTAVIFHP
ncbi:MAG: hypothetical protein N2314_06705 [Brevinematales bacterium]|nr:hypothetical protein [Brevinematales bacterium]